MLAAQIAALPFEMLCPHSLICRRCNGQVFFFWPGSSAGKSGRFWTKRTLQQYYYGRFDTWSLNGGKQAIHTAFRLKKNYLIPTRYLSVDMDDDVVECVLDNIHLITYCFNNRFHSNLLLSYITIQPNFLKI